MSQSDERELPVDAAVVNGDGNSADRAVVVNAASSLDGHNKFPVREVGNQATWSLSSCKPGKRSPR